MEIFMEDLSIDIQRLVVIFERLAKAEWRKQPSFGVKNSEARTLLCIKDLSTVKNQAVTVSEISKKMNVTSPTITQIINHLNDNGYVKRSIDSKDKRYVDISLTEKGEKIVSKTTEYLNVLFSGLIDKLGMEQYSKLIVLLDQVCEYLDEPTDSL